MPKFFKHGGEHTSLTLAKLNPLLELMLHDNMFYMTSAIRIYAALDLKLLIYDYEHMFELNKLPHQDTYY